MKFLVPTDFSPCAENASRYAAALASATGSELFFVHVLTPLVDDNTFLAVDAGAVQEELAQRVEKQAADVCHEHGIACGGAVVVGEVLTAVLDKAGTYGPDLIIMGTHGADGLDTLFGSNTASVIEKSTCPVIAVPERASFEPLHNIVYATDYENSDIHALKQLAHVASFFGAEINVVHVASQYEERGTELSVIDYFADLVNKNVGYPKITCGLFKHSDVEKGIDIFAQTVGAGMVALATRRRNLFDKLFNRSLARDLAGHSTVPLLAFHVNEAEQVDGHLEL